MEILSVGDIITMATIGGFWDVAKIAGSALTGAASGGIFGLVGSIASMFLKMYQEKQRQVWEAKKWDHETAMQELNMRAKAAETEQELAIVSQQGSWAGLTESHRSEQSIGEASMWANNIRALFRPFLTVATWVLAAVVFFKITSGSLKEWFTVAELKDLIQYMVFTVFFCASTSHVWWFGDRALTPPGYKNR